MDPKQFYAKKLELLATMTAQIEATRSLLAKLSQHEATAPDPDHSEFFFLGDALEEAAVQLDGLVSSVGVVVKYNESVKTRNG